VTLSELVGEGREEAALAFACLRVSNFVTVHTGSSPEECRAAVNVVFEHVGLGVGALSALALFADRYMTPESETAFLLGVLVGLYALDYET
jgi:hypothetical protein